MTLTYFIYYFNLLIRRFLSPIILDRLYLIEDKIIEPVVVKKKKKKKFCGGF